MTRHLIPLSLVGIFGGLFLALFGCGSRGATSNASGSDKSEMRVSAFRQITGTGFSMARAYMKKESGILENFESDSYGKRAEPARNLIFASIDDLSGRWLLPHNRFLILATEELPPEKDKSIVGVYNLAIPEERVARWIYIEEIKSDTNNNGKLDYEDRRAIGIADPSGANYTEVVTEADEILQRTMHTEDKLILVYQLNAKLFIADIDLPQRQVTTKDLPSIP